MNLEPPSRGEQRHGWLLAAGAAALLMFVLPSTSFGQGAGNRSLGFAQLQSSPRNGNLPLSFEANEGQADVQVKFLARGRGYNLFLTSTEAILSLRSTPATLRLTLRDANSNPELQPLEALPGRANYFIGHDPNRWHTAIATYARVACREVYAGIDLVYYGAEGRLEFDFVLRPGADPAAIRLQCQGADRLELDQCGGLVARLGGVSVRWPKPLVYQVFQGQRNEVPGAYVLLGPHEIGFQVSGYDPNCALVIDPVLIYSTYLGGSGLDAAEAMAVDRGGNVYVTGETLSLNFPTTNSYRSTLSGSNDVFVTKLNSNGTALVFSTYFGGSGNDIGRGIAVDASSNVFVTGQTDSADFPTRNAKQSSPGGGGFSDAFLVKLGPAGSNLLYSTYFGGGAAESGNAIAVDSSGKAYVAGETESGSGFPATQNPFQRRAGGGLDAFVAKFDPSASGNSSLVYASWLGGLEDERATAIGVDASGNAYVAGVAFSFDFSTSTFPVVNALQPNYGGGGSDAFVAKINAAGSGPLLFATFLGGVGEDTGLALALDPSANIYITGQTSSSDFPVTPGAMQFVIGDAGYFSTMDAFVAKLPSGGANVLYATFLGGEIDESGTAIAVDGNGQIFVAGQTDSVDFPATVGAVQPSYGGGPNDAFVARINPFVPGPSGLIYASFLGDKGDETATGLVLDTNSTFYVCGLTTSTTNLASAAAFQAHYGGGYSDAFVARFASQPDLSVSIVASPTSVVVNNNLTYTLQVNNNGRSTFTGVTLTNVLPAGVQVLSLTNNRGSCNNVSGTITCSFGTMTNNASATVTIVVKTTAPGPLTNSAVLSANEPEVNTGNNQPVLVTPVFGLADLSVSQTDAPDPVPVGGNLTYTFTVTNQGPWPATQIMLTDVMSPTVDYISLSQSQGSYSFGFGTILFDLGDLDAHTSASVTVVVSPSTLDPVTNEVDVSTFDLDSNQANNSSVVTTAVITAADLAVSLAAAPVPAIPGSNLTYSVTVSNGGPSTASSVMLTNTLPAGAAFVSAQSTQGTCSRLGAIVTCNLGSVGSGSAVGVTIVVTPSAEGVLTNVSRVGSGLADLNLPNNAATNITPAFLPTDVAILVSDAPDPVNSNGNLVYSVTVTNRGTSTATGVTVTDVFPGSASFVSATSTQGSCARTGSVVTCPLGSIPSGAAASLTLTVTPLNPGSITNVASVATAGTDSNLANNSATNITRVNSPPTISHIADQTINEDTLAGPIGFTVGDLETSAANLLVLASSSNTGLVSSTSFIYGGSGASRTLSFLPVTNQFGSATITLNVADSDNGIKSTNFSLTVNSVNHAPTLNPITSLLLSVNAGAQLVDLTGISAGPANEQQGISITATSSLPAVIPNPAVNYSSPNSTAVLVLSPAPNATGTATVTVNVQDDGGTANGGQNKVSRAFQVTVTTPPPLRIARNNNQVVLSWATNSIGYDLQRRTSLASTNPWVPVTNVPAVTGGQNVVTDNINAGNTFFRLRSR